MSDAKAVNRCVFLFSSNSEPLYAQNVLDVLAAPPGAVKQWRYSRRWVSADFAAAVRDGSIVGLPALLHFSLQQRAELQEAALLPIRSGRIAEAKIVSDGFFIIRVKLDVDAGLASGLRDETDLGSERYKSLLGAHGIPHPYEASASIGPELSPGECFITGGQESGLFESNVRWLAETDTFRAARFFRFYRLTEHGASAEISADDEGTFQLSAGKTYELELFLFQPGRIEEGNSFEIFCDQVAVSVLGRRTFDLASSYDLVHVQIAVSLPTEMTELKTMLAIAPLGNIQGPKMELPLRILANRADRAITVGGSALTLLLLAAQALVTGTAAKVGLLVAAVVLGTLLALRNRPIAPLAGGIKGTFLPQYQPTPVEASGSEHHHPAVVSHSA